MNKLTRISATVVSTFALVAGFTAMAGASSISGTGDDSENRVSQRSYVRTDVENDTEVDVENNNPQTAKSGDAQVEDNDEVESVSTGASSNHSTAHGSVWVNNSSATHSATSGMGGSGWGDATISDTDDDSENYISQRSYVSTNVENDTDVKIENNNRQYASSGDAHVEDNDEVGSVTTGNASNTSSSTFEVHVTN